MFDIEATLRRASLKRYHGINSQVVYYDSVTNEVLSFLDDSVVKDHLQGKWVEFNAEHGEVVRFTYRPNKPRITASNSYFKVNIWNTWEQVHPRQTGAQLPSVIQCFMEHLFPCERSREYVFDWVANSLQARNYTYLTLVSAPGTGKGVFSTILAHLVGVNNFSIVGSDTVKGRFNGEIIDKHIVFIDELNISMKDKDAINRLKSFANDTISVEQKGLQRKQVDNHASFVIATNQLKGLPVEAGDRRFSIVDVTDTKSRDIPEVQSLIMHGDLLKPDVIIDFYNWLMDRKLDSEAMLVPFQGERSKEVADALLPDWIAVIEEEFEGQTSVSIIQIQAALEEAGIKPPGRRVIARAFEMVSNNRAPGRFFFNITKRLRDW